MSTTTPRKTKTAPAPRPGLTRLVSTTGRPIVILNLGMGVESVALLVRYLLDPTSRDFDLGQLVVVTAMTGDEFPDTGALMERFVLPLLRAHGVRFVQLARARAKKGRGGWNVVVLDDSTSPARVHLGGAYRLSQELAAAGTVASSGGDRRCSMHAKGEVIDAWLREVLGEQPFRQLFGFNAAETRRAADDQKAQAQYARRGLPGRRGEYPLIAWGWDRARCQACLHAAFALQVDWPKSCCWHCPFTGGRPEVLARYRAFPELAAEACFLEHGALALNPRMLLYNRKGVRQVLERDGNAAALALFQAKLDDPAQPWAVYRVRRLYKGKGVATRHVGVLAKGTRQEAEAELSRRAALAGVTPAVEAGSLRALLRGKSEKPKAKRGASAAEKAWAKARTDALARQDAEEFLVAAPLVAQAKAGNGWSEEKWETRVGLELAGAGCAA